MTQLPLHSTSKLPPPNAFASSLPIVHKATEAYKLWNGFLDTFPRLSRFTLGIKIDTVFTETIELLFLAGYTSKPQKLLIVQRAATKLDALKFFLNIAWELKALDNKKYIRLSEPLVEVGKMLGGWRKQLESNTPAE